MDATNWNENTGERRAWKHASGVRRRAGGKGLEPQYLACGLSYLVVFHSDKQRIQRAAETLEHWLEGIGLQLHPVKTKITHTLTPVDGQVGFDFLGFTVRQFQVGKTHTGKDPKGKPLGFKTIIKPSKQAIKRHLLELKKRIRELQSVSQEAVIKALDPVIWGWANYYKMVACYGDGERKDTRKFTARRS